MNQVSTLELILTSRLVAIIRMQQAEGVLDAINAVIEGGINVLEVTSNTPFYTHQIGQARTKYPDAIVGAGTVLTTAMAKEAVDSGAQFLVTPNTNPEIIEAAKTSAVPLVMGAFTATEVVAAHQKGADIVKLFPASLGGIPYLKALKGPLDNIRLFAVGGINIDNARDWLNAGVDGLGIGSKIIAADADGRINLDQTRKNASLFREIADAC